MALFLGIDGGGTGCRAAVADDAGRILGTGRAGPANVNSDPDGTLSNVLAATAEALDGTGAHPQDLIAVLGLAGANVTSAAQALAAALPFARSHVVTDAVTAARGALGDRDGIVAAIGTGSVFAVCRGGRLRQYGGRGFVLGDEGSGAVMGRMLLARALRAEDGFEPMTPLLRTVLQDLGGIEGVIRFASSSAPAGFAALMPRLLGADDPAARSILAAGVADVRAILARLQADGPLPVVFLGGLGAHYAAALAGLWEQRAPLGSGVDGALAMARGLTVGA